jgi:hypothetical protein
MIAQVERSQTTQETQVRPPFRRNRWVRIMGGFDGKYNGFAAQINKVSREEGMIQVTVDGAQLWFEDANVTLITKEEGLSTPVLDVNSQGSELLQIDSRIDTQTEALVTQDSATIEASRARLAELEKEVEDGLEYVRIGKVRIWNAIERIRVEELWKLTEYPGFEQYCQSRFNWGRSMAYESAFAGKVVGKLLEAGVEETHLPTNLEQVRTIKMVQDEHRPEVLREAYEISNGRMTGGAILSAAERLKAPIVYPPYKVPAPKVTDSPSVQDGVTGVPVENAIAASFRKGRGQINGIVKAVLIDWKQGTVAYAIVEHGEGDRSKVKFQSLTLNFQ